MKRGSYWKFEGNYAICVHVLPGIQQLTFCIRTTCPEFENPNDPWYDRLEPTRTAQFRYCLDGE
eukprot:8984477-Lingulodinium_polyedra.AAC.1